MFGFLLTTLSAAQPPPPVTTLASALLKRVADAQVSAARVDLAAAERAAVRVAADPFALRLPRLQARHALSDARAALQSALFAAQLTTQDAYFGVLEAADAVRLAERALEHADTTLGATQIRFEAGAATVVEVGRARNALRGATRDLDAERTRGRLATAQLAARLGMAAETLSLQEPTTDPVVPKLGEVLARSQNNQEVRAAAQALEEARVYLAGVDNAFSARTEVEGAQVAFRAARTALAERRRSVALAVRSAHSEALAFRDALQAAGDADATEEAALEVQQARFDGGSISRLELMQAELDAATSTAALRRARHELARTVSGLEGVVRGSAGVFASSDAGIFTEGVDDAFGE